MTVHNRFINPFNFSNFLPLFLVKALRKKVSDSRNLFLTLKVLKAKAKLMNKKSRLDYINEIKANVQFVSKKDPDRIFERTKSYDNRLDVES